MPQKEEASCGFYTCDRSTAALFQGPCVKAITLLPWLTFQPNQQAHSYLSFIDKLVMKKLNSVVLHAILPTSW